MLMIGRKYYWQVGSIFTNDDKTKCKVCNLPCGYFLQNYARLCSLFFLRIYGLTLYTLIYNVKRNNLPEILNKYH